MARRPRWSLLVGLLLAASAPGLGGSRRLTEEEEPHGEASDDVVGVGAPPLGEDLAGSRLSGLAPPAAASVLLEQGASGPPRRRAARPPRNGTRGGPPRSPPDEGLPRSVDDMLRALPRDFDPQVRHEMLERTLRSVKLLRIDLLWLAFEARDQAGRLPSEVVATAMAAFRTLYDDSAAEGLGVDDRATWHRDLRDTVDLLAEIGALRPPDAARLALALSGFVYLEGLRSHLQAAFGDAFDRGMDFMELACCLAAGDGETINEGLRLINALLKRVQLERMRKRRFSAGVWGEALQRAQHRMVFISLLAEARGSQAVIPPSELHLWRISEASPKELPPQTAPGEASQPIQTSNLVEDGMS